MQSWGVLGIFPAHRDQEIPQSSLGTGTESPSICPGQYKSRDTLEKLQSFYLGSQTEAGQGQTGQLGGREVEDNRLLIPPRDKAGEGAKHRVGLACEHPDRAMSCWA